MKRTSVMVSLLIFVFLVFNSSCKTSEEEDTFSILGNWTINITYASIYVYTGGTITFAGSATSGIVSVNFPPDTEVGTGPYTVSGSTVNFTINWPIAAWIDTCTGTIINNNSMNGTLIENPGNTPGTWNCTR